MDKKERFVKAYNYLRSEGIIATQLDIANAMQAARPNISLALKGDPKVLTDRFLIRFCRAFPDTFNYDWLTKGEGTMLLESSETVTAPIDKQQDALTYAAIQVGMLTAKLEAALMRIEKQEKELTDRLREIDEIKNRILSPRYPTVMPDDLQQENKKVAEP